MTNIKLCTSRTTFLFNIQQECTYSNCVKYLKLRLVGKTLKIVKCTLRSEPKMKTRTGPAYYASKKTEATVITQPTLVSIVFLLKAQ